MRYQPRRLLIFDIYENCAYELETELRNKYGAEAPSSRSSAPSAIKPAWMRYSRPIIHRSSSMRPPTSMCR